MCALYAYPGTSLSTSAARDVPTAARVAEALAPGRRDGDRVLQLDEPALGVVQLRLDRDHHSGLQLLVAVPGGVPGEGVRHEPGSLVADDAHAVSGEEHLVARRALPQGAVRVLEDLRADGAR